MKSAFQVLFNRLPLSSSISRKETSRLDLQQKRVHRALGQWKGAGADVDTFGQPQGLDVP